MRPTWAILIVSLLAAALAGPAAGQTPAILSAGPVGDAQAEQMLTPPTTQPEPPPAGRGDPFQNIRIDRDRSRVLVRCHPIDGGEQPKLMELIACSPHTREHEAVLTVLARPQEIHLALMVCGFEPGRPPGWDPKAEKVIPPSGDRIDIVLEWTDPKTGKPRAEPVERWLLPAAEGGKAPDLVWLFCGSQQFENGRYYADVEGSVVTLASFPDEVLGLPGVQDPERANDQLEFQNNPAAIPPEKTAVTMVLMPPADLQVALDRFGKAAVEGRPVQPDRLDQLLARHRRSRDDARVELAVAPDTIEADVTRLIERCVKAGFAAERVVRRAAAAPAADAPATQPEASVFPVNDPRAALDLLTGQWRQQRAMVAQTVAGQRDWFAHLDSRRELFARQYGELADYLRRSQRQYRQAVSQFQRPK